DIGDTLSRAERIRIPEPWITPPDLQEKIHIFAQKCLFLTESLKQFTEKMQSDMEKIQELREAQLYSVDVTLDPDTAYPSLILSDNLRQVRYSYLQQDLPDNPERFNLFPCVLGSPCFIAGRHYWEVEVGDKAKWTIGVCEDSVCRKGGVTSAPQNGFWAVSLWYGKEYWALTSPMTALPLRTPLQRVGIFLDYDAARNTAVKAWNVQCCAPSGTGPSDALRYSVPGLGSAILKARAPRQQRLRLRTLFSFLPSFLPSFLKILADERDEGRRSFVFKTVTSSFIHELFPSFSSANDFSIFGLQLFHILPESALPHPPGSSIAWRAVCDPVGAVVAQWKLWCGPVEWSCGVKVEAVVWPSGSCGVAQWKLWCGGSCGVAPWKLWCGPVEAVVWPPWKLWCGPVEAVVWPRGSCGVAPWKLWGGPVEAVVWPRGSCGVAPWKLWCDPVEAVVWPSGSCGVALWKLWCGPVEAVVWPSGSCGVAQWKLWCGPVEAVVWPSGSCGVAQWKLWCGPVEAVVWPSGSCGVAQWKLWCDPVEAVVWPSGSCGVALWKLWCGPVEAVVWPSGSCGVTQWKLWCGPVEAVVWPCGSCGVGQWKLWCGPVEAVV
ncbi:hypothetical protein STEG23_026753, partial [Scotinomys teguina]